LVFGLPAYSPPASTSGGTVTVRHGLDGRLVLDAAVGGGTNCGLGLDFWTQWGNQNYAGLDRFNVQNQHDVADWPCFSKYYVTFPLDAVPAGKVIVSAQLTLYQIGSAGDGWQPLPESSFIQVLTTDGDWRENTLTWNNAPLAAENLGGIWLDPVTSSPQWPGIPRQWDVSRAVAQAYAARGPLRLVLYSADAAYHSGRYFSSSDAGDWNAAGRPALSITWGNPPGAPTATATRTPTAVARGTSTPTHTPVGPVRAYLPYLLR
jgi:hypothetical protein